MIRTANHPGDRVVSPVLLLSVPVPAVFNLQKWWITAKYSQSPFDPKVAPVKDQSNLCLEIALPTQPLISKH